jgi:hypothetical protein
MDYFLLLYLTINQYDMKKKLLYIFFLLVFSVTNSQRRGLKTFKFDTPNFSIENKENIPFDEYFEIYGSFSEDDKTETKNTDVNGISKENYIVPQNAGTVFFDAKTGIDERYLKNSIITFKRANADELIIEPTKIVMDIISANTIKVFLKRNIGKVSIETEVDFFSYQIVGVDKVEVGRFTGLNEAKSNLDGMITVDFIADTKDFDKGLPIFIKVSANKDDTSILSKEIELKFE